MIAVELRRLSKRFGSLVANHEIDLSVKAGTIHAIVGENGAGKSTAMKMLYGMIQPDSGEIRINGQVKKWSSPRHAIEAGIGMVHQHFMLADPYSALDNVLVGTRGQSALRPSPRAAVRAKLEALSTQYGLEVDWDERVERLPVGVQQRIEILKALERNAEILILDEPTAVLTPQETDELFVNFRKLVAEGKTILIITHKLREVKRLASMVTVFRAGRVVANVEASGTSEQELADLMVGRQVRLMVAVPPPGVLKEPAIELEGVTTTRLKQLTFKVRGGEVVGIAGVEGNGQQELLDLLIEPQETGRSLSGKYRCLGIDSAMLDTGAIRRLGVGVIPSDRLREGLLLESSMTDNFLLGLQRDARFSRNGLLSAKALKAVVSMGLDAYDVRPRDPDAAAGRLSGGNQQKAIIARELWLRKDVKLLIAAQPTRGVDVGAIEFIHERILEARNRGVAVLLVSSELSEVMALSDRILVMVSGRVVAEVSRSPDAASGGEGYDETRIGLWMGGAV